ncbi:DUF4293 family protein [Fulvivirga sp. M361]|uniref:DUF4293 domain-containing protein n=1 Tax=Fulvivirga sp. M361 TaxID=2594266 RepID=UPI00117B2416|nr:DUF4293 domain-containing protein [Fulvivirga sp. M361]TRX48890.1 DUF4293 family protein [Fulvivirga sp. M361]
MLQRIQTVFLLLVALMMLLTLFFPFWTYQAVDSVEYYGLFAFYFERFDLESEELVRIYFPFTLIATMAVAAITVASLEITRYNNRLLQIKLGALNSLLIAGTLILAAYFATDFIKSKGVAGHYGIAFFLPAAALIFNLLANRYIRKDEKLVRSVDRIR